VAVVEFRADGAPRHASIKLAPDRDSCRRVAQTLFLMSRPPDSVADPSADRAVYLVPLRSAAIACTESPGDVAPKAAAESDVVRVRGRVQAPKLDKRVEPAYPEAVRKKHEQGVSVYEAIITRTGCVTDLRLVRSSYPELDMLGMEAIAQWKYRPAALDGRPVRVYLSVTVTYRLN
jgi:TonB family protein